MKKSHITAVLAAMLLTSGSIAVWGGDVEAQSKLAEYTLQTAGQAVTREICRVRPEGPPRLIDQLPSGDNAYTPVYDRPLPCGSHYPESKYPEHILRGYTDATSPAAVILDDSYTPIHDRPVHCPHHIIPERPYPQDVTVGVHDCSYHDHLDEDSDQYKGLLAAVAQPCDICSREMHLCDEYFYEMASCGHAVYFIGAAGKDCAHVRVHRWVFTCDCV